jgi:cytochrome c55X
MADGGSSLQAAGPGLRLFLGCVALASAASATSLQAAALPGEPSVQRQRELVRLVRQDCGSCHGLTLGGGLGPPLLPAALQDKPVESLVSTVLYGRPATPMPPWGAFLSEDEAEWVVQRLLKGFPDEF